MPLECPRFTVDYNFPYSKYNACLSCGARQENECWHDIKSPRKLSEILTTSERLSILEDKKEIPEVNIVTITKQDYQQLQRLILLLEKKLISHIAKKQNRTRDRI